MRPRITSLGLGVGAAGVSLAQGLLPATQAACTGVCGACGAGCAGVVAGAAAGGYIILANWLGSHNVKPKNAKAEPECQARQQKDRLENGKFHHIKALSHNDTSLIFDRVLRKITRVMLIKNSTDVDGISGATVSSKGIIDAVNNAVEQAAKK